MKLSKILALALISSASAFSTPTQTSSSSTSLSMSDTTTESTMQPNPVIKLAANGMSLLKPIFGLEAQLQAAVLGAISNVDKEAVAGDIDVLKSQNKVLIYTYGLSPFSTEALSILEASGYEYTNV